MESPSIQDGAQIKLRGNNFSQLRRAIAKKPLEVIDGHDEAPAFLDDLAEILGGGFG
jgi:hypothetical protein